MNSSLPPLSSPVTTASPETTISAQSDTISSPVDFEGHTLLPVTAKAEERDATISTPANGGVDLSASAIFSELQPFNVISHPNEISARIAADLPQQIQGSLDGFLRAKGVHLDRINVLGSGQFGTVHPATIEGHDFVFKEESVLVSLTHRELNGKLWRCGDIAASRLQDLPHFAKAEFFILRVRDAYGNRNETWYVPTSQIKAFGQKLNEENPGLKVTILGSLMSRAPGKELLDCLSEHSIDPLTDFDPISHQLFEFLEVTHARNFIHRDIKLENIIYDPSTKTLTVIDSSTGGVYAKRGKESSRSGNPKTSSRTTGTPGYTDPRVRRGAPHDSTVDFYSAGISLFLTLTKGDAASYNTILDFSDSREAARLTPTAICEQLLSMLKEIESPIIGILEQNPQMKTTIELFFAVANETPGAFEALQERMHG